MSGTTVNGGSVPNQWTGTAGASQAFFNFFNSTKTASLIMASGDSTATGSVVIGASNLTVTVSGAALADTSSGSNKIDSLNPSTIFAAPNDTISSAAATTLFGASSGVTNFSFSGADSSITGGAGGMSGVSTGANSTLVGGTGGAQFTVTGANSTAVAGPGPGITGIDETASTGPELISENPGATAGTLVATLGSGADTVLGGGGFSYIQAGTGPDVFGFINGTTGGTEIINGFNPADTLVFAGYSAPPTEDITSFLGVTTDIVTLSDNTKIYLLGVTKPIF